MPGAHRSLQLGPDTFEVSAPVVGGQLVEPDGTTGKIKPATAASTRVIGVALADAAPATANPPGPGQPLVIHTLRPHVAVANSPTDVDVVYSGAAQRGDRLAATANGQVAPAGSNPVVGICTSNTVAAGQVGRMRLTV